MFIIIIILLIIILVLSAKYPWWLPNKKGIVVLMYHHVCKYDNTCDMDKSFYIEPEVFEKQIDFLLKLKYTPITLKDLEKSYKDNLFILPKKPVLITFDDGWQDNYTNAYRILKEKNVKANIFLAYNYIGQKNCLTWEQITEMKKSGLISFGSHTITHASLSKLNETEIVNELKESKRLLEEKLQQKINCFAYPKGAGASDDKIRKMVFDTGYLFDFSTKRGITSFKYNKQKAIHRLFIKQGKSFFSFYLNITKGKDSF